MSLDTTPLVVHLSEYDLIIEEPISFAEGYEPNEVPQNHAMVEKTIECVTCIECLETFCDVLIERRLQVEQMDLFLSRVTDRLVELVNQKGDA